MPKGNRKANRSCCDTRFLTSKAMKNNPCIWRVLLPNPVSSSVNVASNENLSHCVDVDQSGPKQLQRKNKQKSDNARHGKEILLPDGSYVSRFFNDKHGNPLPPDPFVAEAKAKYRKWLADRSVCVSNQPKIPSQSATYTESTCNVEAISTEHTSSITERYSKGASKSRTFIDNPETSTINTNDDFVQAFKCDQNGAEVDLNGVKFMKEADSSDTVKSTADPNGHVELMKSPAKAKQHELLGRDAGTFNTTSDTHAKAKNVSFETSNAPIHCLSFPNVEKVEYVCTQHKSATLVTSERHSKGECRTFFDENVCFTFVDDAQIAGPTVNSVQSDGCNNSKDSEYSGASERSAPSTVVDLHCASNFEFTFADDVHTVPNVNDHQYLLDQDDNIFETIGESDVRAEKMSDEPLVSFLLNDEDDQSLCVDESNCIEVETANRLPITDKVSEPKHVAKHIFADENVSFTFVDDAVAAATFEFEEFDDITDEMLLKVEL